ncbi:MAG: chorismate lyase [Limnobacter sp.]|nr:chorismate lyase [Limnobacter sp.]
MMHSRCCIRVQARWHAHCPASWPLWARTWATSKGSLTRRLVGLGQGFEVQPVFQGAARCTLADSLATGWQPSQAVRARMVRLKTGGQTVVVARTLMRHGGQSCDWPFWWRLGSQSLGTMLFCDPAVVRGQVVYAQLAHHTPWVLAMLRNPDGTLPAPLADAPCWYARAARYSKGAQRTPLWVFEVFCPACTASPQERINEFVLRRRRCL